jgi:hypothetical protein
MESGLLAELSPHERNTLLRIANRDDRSGPYDPAYITRLQNLNLIDDGGPFVELTPLGKQRIELLKDQIAP